MGKLAVNELIDGLCEGDSVEELKDLLSVIPTELEELYTRAIRRTCSTSLRTIGKHRMEAYILFQIVLHARVPFQLAGLLAATLFLTTQKETYHELPKRLSLDQMQRRLNSRSAGLLEVIGLASGSQRKQDFRQLDVQFIHQTVKNLC